jgi:polysaccharide export outer membrane protein
MGTRQIFSKLVVAILLAAGGVTYLAAQANPRIVERDQIVVTVWGVKEYSNKYPVGADGAVEFPDLGRVKLAGLTVREAADLIAKNLKEAGFLLNPQVTVELEQTPNKRITVNGPVRSPGIITYAGEMMLLEALVKAGGLLPEAADEVLVVRAPSASTQSPDDPEPDSFEVNARALENGVLKHNIVLQDGDQVFVRKAQAVTVTGFVNRVGAYTIESGMNVEQVLALAGGIDPIRGSDKRIDITRKVDGKTVTFRAKKTDAVKPGDIIRVGRRFA